MPPPIPLQREQSAEDMEPMDEESSAHDGLVSRRIVAIGSGTGSPSPRPVWKTFGFGIGMAIAGVLVLATVIAVVSAQYTSNPQATWLSTSANFETHCLHIQNDGGTATAAAVQALSSSLRQHRSRQKFPLWILNATIWTADGAGGEFIAGRSADLFLSGGVITKIVSPSAGVAAQGEVIVQAHGRPITAGLVDLHSHLGVYPYFEDFWAAEDGNEMSSPITPQVRAIDAYDPEDTGIVLSRRGGVTTVQVLPGSANVMGGEGFIAKLSGDLEYSSIAVEGVPLVLKMACGENPKRVYGKYRKTAPYSRMGSAWLMREQFEKARNVITAQEAWCRTAVASRPPAGGFPAFPDPLALRGLVQLLRGRAALNVHCYQVQDLQMMIRLSQEFNFSISAFHHALEAYKIADLIAAANITVSTFSDLWGYKLEAFDASVHAPKILEKAGVKVSLKSDHPVIFSKRLIEESAEAYHYGMSAAGAIAAVTSVPAAAMGLGSTIGTIAEQYDADLVIWDKHPLRLGARPDKVFLNGYMIEDADLPVVSGESSPPNNQRAYVVCSGELIAGSTYAILNVRVATLSETQGTIRGSIVVVSGRILCVGDCSIPPSAIQCDMASLPHAMVIPGFIESASPVGQQEVGAEPITHDGDIESSPSDIVKALDGIVTSTRHVNATRSGGVTTVIVRPEGESLFLGEGTAFLTVGETVKNSIISASVGLWLNVGQDAKDKGLSSSISGQIAWIRQQLTSAEPSAAFAAVRNGTQPLVLVVRSADIMSALLRLKSEIAANISMIFVGGTGAWLIAKDIAAAKVPVVLTPVRCQPNRYITRNCNNDGIKILLGAGVTVGLAAGDPDNVRILRWETGWARQMAGLGFEAALALSTSAVADIFGLGPCVGRICPGNLANFALFSNDPLGYGSYPMLIAQQSHVFVNPQQY